MSRWLTSLALALSLAAATSFLIPVSGSSEALAAGSAGHKTAGSTQAPTLRGLALSASPSIVDVGDNVVLVLVARAWPARASVTVSFLSGHHGFTGQMVWNGSCSCFRVAVSLARRIHQLEPARAIATVVLDKHKFTAATRFLIRGLAPDGIRLAPGGPEALTTWVSDPQPNSNEQLHLCAWVKTPDGLGVPRVPIKFWLHYPGKSLVWNAGFTNGEGIQCNRRRLPASAANKTVVLDVYAGTMHAQTRLKPLS